MPKKEKTPSDDHARDPVPSNTLFYPVNQDILPFHVHWWVCGIEIAPGMIFDEPKIGLSDKRQGSGDERFGEAIRLPSLLPGPIVPGD